MHNSFLAQEDNGSITSVEAGKQYKVVGTDVKSITYELNEATTVTLFIVE